MTQRKMYDKHGNILKVGDRVVYRKGTFAQDFGTVVEPEDNYGDVWAIWDNDSGVTYCSTENAELYDLDEFTPEDEILLQQLLAKKHKYLEECNAAGEKFNAMMRVMDEESLNHALGVYVSNNIDEICTTLQNYKKTRTTDK